MVEMVWIGVYDRQEAMLSDKRTRRGPHLTPYLNRAGTEPLRQVPTQADQINML